LIDGHRRRWALGLLGLLWGQAALAELPFGPGEECVFRIGYGVVDAGEATLSVESEMDYYGSRVLHLRTRARSNRFFSAFFRVRDQADSYIDADSLYSRYFNKHLREGNYQRGVEIHFDHVQRKAYFPNGKENDIPHGVQDVLSAFFRVRAMQLPDSLRLRLPTHGDKKLYDMEVIVHGREVLDTVLGRVRCVKVQPILADEGLFKHQGDLLVWLTDDARRIPVLLRANIPVGAIEGKLVKYTPPRARKK
jgi:hypothetical protein